MLVGCSSIVGKPLAMELLGSGCTVTLAHKTTPPERLEEDIGRADIVIVATGVPNLIPGVSYVKRQHPGLQISSSCCSF